MRDWDAAENLTDDETIAAFLERAALRNDKDFFDDCLTDAVRAKMINELALKTGIDRREIFETVSPDIETPPAFVAKFTTALGITSIANDTVTTAVAGQYLSVTASEPEINL